MKAIVFALLLTATLPLPLTAANNTDSDLYYVVFTYRQGRPLGRLRVKSAETGQFLTDCTAFLSGPQQITTAGHCITFGIEGAVFDLHYDNEKSTASSRVASVLATGGGFGNNEELKGWDWVHLRLAEPLGERLLSDGRKVGWFKLSNDGEATNPGKKVELVSYMKDWQKGEKAGWQKCDLKNPPDDLKERYCTKVGERDGKTLWNCNFFEHTCRISAEGLDSGAPLLSPDSGEVVGIHVGRRQMAQRLTGWGMTVNEALEPAANIYIAWLHSLHFQELDRLSRAIVAKELSLDITGANDPMSKRYASLLEKWPTLTEVERFREVQYWDTVAAQNKLAELNRDLDTQVTRAERRASLVIRSVTGLETEHEGKLAFAQSYNRGVAQTLLGMLAQRKVARDTEETRVVALQRQERDAKQRERDSFARLVTEARRRAAAINEKAEALYGSRHPTTVSSASNLRVLRDYSTDPDTYRDPKKLATQLQEYIVAAGETERSLDTEGTRRDEIRRTAALAEARRQAEIRALRRDIDEAQRQVQAAIEERRQAAARSSYAPPSYTPPSYTPSYSPTYTPSYNPPTAYRPSYTPPVTTPARPAAPSNSDSIQDRIAWWERNYPQYTR